MKLRGRKFLQLDMPPLGEVYIGFFTEHRAARSHARRHKKGRRVAPAAPSLPWCLVSAAAHLLVVLVDALAEHPARNGAEKGTNPGRMPSGNHVA